MRAALPQHSAAASLYVNTRTGLPLAKAAHVALLIIELPSDTRHAPTLALEFELRDRADPTSVVQTAHWPGDAGGFGVVVPSPFYYPTEGVPAYLNVTLVPTGGICIGGDNGGMRCSDMQECAGGFCELYGDNAYSCVDTQKQGVAADSLCSRPTQCPYGRCYGHSEAPSEQGAYPALAEFLVSRRTETPTGSSAARRAPSIRRSTSMRLPHALKRNELTARGRDRLQIQSEFPHHPIPSSEEERTRSD